MGMEESISKLTEEACPSIRYRVRRDILGESIYSQEMMALQGRIMEDEKVKEVLSWQKNDGWLGGTFHGDCEPETGIRILIEKGVESCDPVIVAALNAMIARGADFDKGSLERVGKLLDSGHLGGSQMIKACVFSYAGHEDHDFVQQQIEEALFGFASTLSINSSKLLYRLHKGKVPVFDHDRIWPGIYHLRLLAYTNSWRTPEKLQLLCDAINHMILLCPLPEIKLLHKSQIIAPAQMNFMNELAKPIDRLSPKEWMLWLHGAELIARLGIADRLPAVYEQMSALSDYLKSNGWLFTIPLSHYYFHRWSPYIGLALENSWRSKDARICDLTFRSLLILKLARTPNFPPDLYRGTHPAFIA